MPENQTAWNSDNQGIKETVKQNNQTSKNAWWGGGPGGQGWLKVKLSLRIDCGLRWLLWWEKLPVSHKNPLESVLELSRRAALFPLWPLLYRQHHSAARRVALPLWILKAPPLYNLSAIPRQRNVAQMKEQSKTSERELSDEEMANLLENLKPW